MPAGYLKMAKYISKGERARSSAAAGVTKDKKSYHFSDSSSKDRRQICKRTVNALKASPDTVR